jgi:alkaline phosphatase
LVQAQSNTEYWQKHAIKSIKRASSIKINTKSAKNVILFLGDGLSLATITAARILKGQIAGNPGEETVLAFEKFPHVSLIKVNSIHF